MRKPSLIAFLAALGTPALALAQAGRTHEGFYLSAGLSPAAGAINQDASNGPYAHSRTTGAGVQMDLRIGGALAPNNILSLDLSSRGIGSPRLEVDGSTRSLGDDARAGNVITGLGFTHYFMPSNSFIGVTLGSGRFVFDDGTRSGSSRPGFGYILRGGKEWWVSRHWGLGVAGGLGRLSARDRDDPAYPAYTSTLTTTQVFLGFSATFN